MNIKFILTLSRSEWSILIDFDHFRDSLVSLFDRDRCQRKELGILDKYSWVIDHDKFKKSENHLSIGSLILTIHLLI